MIVGRGARVLIPSFDMRSSAPLPLAMFGIYLPRVQLWETSAAGLTPVGEMDGMPECSLAPQGQSLCYVRRLRRGSIWMVDSTGAPRRVGDLPGSIPTAVHAGPGTTITVSHVDGRIMGVDAVTRQMQQIVLPSRVPTLTEARIAGDRLAIVQLDRGRSRVVLYRLAPAAER